MESFADRLKMLITEKDVRPAEIARKTGISSSGLSRYVRGERLPAALHIGKLANYFKVHPTWLLEGKGQRKTHIEVSKRVVDDNEEHKKALTELEAHIKMLHDHLDLIIDEGDDETQNRILEDIKQAGDKILNKKLSMKEKLLKRIIGE